MYISNPYLTMKTNSSNLIDKSIDESIDESNPTSELIVMDANFSV